ncbi:hypothetical protein [Acinetobacter lactucae]|uniref:Lipoprotein n=1 Tax=Acinetobacter lactucae TaxID=1785128 RepID=A0AB35K1A4_9GAMM|nr:hypothetical protein [Acinetobacter lactucae]MDD9316268.1 hypothetical protein [Acinetobacter lactucae]MDD9320423.1 hypothetical protein [Acinetobacter lactucae]
MSLIKNICILLLSFLLASCLYSPYTKPDAIYVLSGVTKLPEGVVFFNKNKRYQGILFYKQSLSVLYNVGLFSKITFNFRSCAEYVEITSCVWSADIVLNHSEAASYGSILLNDYWQVEDKEGVFYIRSIDAGKRFKRLLNTNQPYIKFSYRASDGNGENVGRFVSAKNIKNNYIEIIPQEVSIFKKPSRVSRMLHVDMR